MYSSFPNCLSVQARLIRADHSWFVFIQNSYWIQFPDLLCKANSNIDRPYGVWAMPIYISMNALYVCANSVNISFEWKIVKQQLVFVRSNLLWSYNSSCTVSVICSYYSCFALCIKLILHVLRLCLFDYGV